MSFDSAQDASFGDAQGRFHVKRPFAVLLLASLLVALFASGCISAAGSRGWARPVQFGDLLLVSASKGKLDAIDPQTGDRKWRFPDDWRIEESKARKLQGIYSQPEISGDTVFVGDYNGWVYAFKPSEASQDAANRKPVGTYELRGAIVGGIHLDSGSETLYITTADGLLYALNASDLKEATSPGKNVRLLFAPVDAGDRIWTPPVVDSGRVYFGTTDGKLYALDAGTGAPVWEPFRASAALVSTPVVSQGTVLVGGFDRRLYAIDASTGKELWHFDATDWIWTKPLVESGTVYFGDFNGKVFAVSLADGKPVWDQPFDALSSVRASPVTSSGNLVVANEAGDLFGLDIPTGSQVWGPIALGKTLHADLLASGSTVYVAPTGCVSEETGNKLYYYKVNTSTRERQSTSSVC